MCVYKVPIVGLASLQWGKYFQGERKKFGQDWEFFLEKIRNKDFPLSAGHAGPMYRANACSQRRCLTRVRTWWLPLRKKSTADLEALYEDLLAFKLRADAALKDAEATEAAVGAMLGRVAEELLR